MVYIEDLKMYTFAAILAIFLIFIAVFGYKWYTKPIPNTYCGEYNNYYCSVGKCGYLTKYETGIVGYCRKKFLTF
jgi:hypothetical protein